MMNMDDPLSYMYAGKVEQKLNYDIIYMFFC